MKLKKTTNKFENLNKENNNFTPIKKNENQMFSKPFKKLDVKELENINIKTNQTSLNNINIKSAENDTNLIKVRNEVFNQSKKFLNNKKINKLSENEVEIDTSSVSLFDSSLESLSGVALNQKTANEENVNEHKKIHNTFNSLKIGIDSIAGKTEDEKEIEEIQLIPDQDASLTEKILPFSITDNNIYFFKSTTNDKTTDFFKNGWLNLIGEKVNNISYNSANSNNSNYYGFYMSIISDYDITFTKFAQPSNLNNIFTGIEKISGYSFPDYKLLNDRTNTTLSENYSNYDFLIFKSKIANNNQTTFNIVKTDKIISDVAINYFGVLQYLTFTNEKDFTISDSSLLEIWGLKNTNQLNRIAILSDTNFSFSETWKNYQFIFVSYYIDSKLSGILIPTNSLIIKNKNIFSIDGRSSFTLENQIEGTFNNIDNKLSNVEIYGLNHILKDKDSSLNTSKIPTVDSTSEDGENQQEVNENVQTDLSEIKTGTYDYSQLTLNNEVITTWPLGNSEEPPTSSEITDDIDINPTLGINPLLTQINTNLENVSLKANQTNFDEINTVVNQNSSDLLKIKEGTYNYPQLNLNGELINNWSSEDWTGNTSLLSLFNSSLESISQTEINQEAVNKENVNNHLSIHDAINDLKLEANNIMGKIADEDEIEEIILLPEQSPSFNEKTLLFPITENNFIYITKNPDGFLNFGLNLIGENLTNAHHNPDSSNDSNYHGFYMHVVSDNDVTFGKFAKPLNASNDVQGVEKISGYSFLNTKLNDRTTTTLSESYLNYDFLIIKSQIQVNQQIIFDIVKTDKIISDVGMSYIGTLKYLTFTNETDFIMNDSSLLGIWGFKNTRKLEKIAILNDANFIFSETWTNYQFIFISYYISGVLGGLLVPTNSIVLNKGITFSLDGRNHLTLISDFEGILVDNDGKLTDIEIYGFNHIWNDWVSSVGTSKISISNSTLEGGNNQAEINENVQNYLTSIKTGIYDYPQLTLNNYVIKTWNLENSIYSGLVTDDKEINPMLGINPNLTQIDKNEADILLKSDQINLDETNLIVEKNNSDLTTIKEGTFDYPQLILDGQTITKWFLEDEAKDTSFVKATDSSLESITGTAINQEIINQENVNDHLVIHNTFDILEDRIKNLKGKITDEEPIEEINIISEQAPSLTEKTLPYPITDNNVYFLKSSTGDKTTDFLRNAGINSIGEKINNISYNTTNSENSAYFGFYSSVISDYDITFTKFTPSSNTTNSFTGIERISAYPFSNIQLNDRTNTSLSESYLNYDFLIIKSQVANNQQTTFNIVKTDKIVSSVATNYFGTLQYLTFTNETDFIASDSSLLGIWGFKNNHQLNRIAVLSDINFSFSETWTNYQFIFVSYYIDNKLSGILIPTNSIILNNNNRFSIDARSSFKLINELEGTFNNISWKLSNVEIYGLNHILKDAISSLNTSKIPTVFSILEGGSNQAEVNENVQNSLMYLNEEKIDQSDLCSINGDIVQNTADLILIKNGTYNYPQLILNNYLIKTWNQGNLIYSGLISDDSDENPTKEINPYLIQGQENTTNIDSLNIKMNNLNTEIDTINTEVTGIIDGTIPIETTPNTSSLIIDSDENPTEGINPYLIQVQENTDNITNLSSEIDILNTEVAGIIDGTIPIAENSLSSLVADDSTTNPTEGINPYLIQTQTNATDIENLNTEVDSLNTEVSGIIDGTIPTAKNSLSSLVTDDSSENPTEGINTWKTQLDENKLNISTKANQLDLDEMNTIVTQNTEDLELIKEGDYNFPQLKLNEEIIESWPSEEDIPSSSELVDDSSENPTEGINPYLIQNQENTQNITNLNTEVETLNTELTGIKNGTIPITKKSLSSLVIDDSSENPTEGINPYLIQTQTNATDIENLNTEVDTLDTEISSLDDTITGIIDGTDPLFVTSISSKITDDSAINPTEGINPWKTQIDENILNIETKVNKSDFNKTQDDIINNRAQLIIIEEGLYNYPQLIINGEAIDEWPSGIEILSSSSSMEDDSATNPTEGINPYLVQVQTNTTDIESLNTEIDALSTEVEGITSGTTVITTTPNTSTLQDDSATNPDEGINPYLVQAQTNTTEIDALSTEVEGITSGTTVITTTPNTSTLQDDSATNPDDGINSYLIQAQTNTTDIESLNTEVDTLSTEVEGITNGTTVITTTPNTSALEDDSVTNPDDGINPYLIQTQTNTTDIESLSTELDTLNTEVAGIISGTTVIKISTSKLIDDSDTNSSRGMNPYLIQGETNVSELTTIKEGNYNYPKLTLNDVTIREWPWKLNITSLLLSENSSLESISENSNIQKNLNVENANAHVGIHNAINTFEIKINNLVGKIADEEEFEETNLISGQNAGLSSRTSFNSITNNNIYFFKSVTSDANINYFKNGGFSLVGENVNNSICDINNNDDNPNYYGFYMNVVSDHEIKFKKFNKSLITNNKFQGIEKISTYSFPSTHLNDGTNTTLSESYLNYDFLIIKSQVTNNQQTTFNIVKTDKIFSNVAMNYFGTLQYLTFTNKTDFTTSDSSLTGIWGFKNNRQLNEISVLNGNNLSFSETWCNYQFIFVSYYINNTLAGILIPTNSLVLNIENVFSIDGRSSFTITSELTGTLNIADENLNNISIYGFNHILKDSVSILSTLEIPTANNFLEGGISQAKVNKNINWRLIKLEKLVNNKSIQFSLNDKNIDKLGSFNYDENYSYPYIKNIDDKTESFTKLRILTNGVDIVDEKNKILMPTKNTNPTPKIYVDNALKTKANKADLKELNLKLNRITESVLNNESLEIINLQKQLDLLILMINKLMLPVGSVIISNGVLPKYGNWFLIKTLLNDKNDSINLNIYKRKS
ncbi:MAG: hypothetical protein HPAVJP_3220 [Candidatus Hepatoplasma vulgare]|nr:MAG: hypothetical protein HPAVJP_3220 [Candidatus Hepatoplasma sp.]